MNELNTFSNYSGVKPNKTKCEIAGIGVGMKCVNLNNKTLKIPGAHFSYNKNLDQDKNLCKHTVKIENILKSWCTGQLTLEGRIMVFKSLAVSKVIHLLLIDQSSCFGILRGSFLRTDMLIKLKCGQNQIFDLKLSPKVPKLAKIHISRTASRRKFDDPSK